MTKSNQEQPDVPPTVVHLDFSGQQADKSRIQREADADHQLKHDPEYRAVTARIADSEERLARDSEAKGCLLMASAVGVAAATVGADLAVAELFHMQQVLQGEDVTQWPQRITHGVILGAGAITSMVCAVVGLGHGFDAEEQRVSAHRHRGY